MKKRLTAILLSTVLAFAPIVSVYADESADVTAESSPEAAEPETQEQKEEETEAPTEKATEKPTEKVTEKATEKPTEKATEKPTEKATEKPAESTTKAASSSNTSSTDKNSGKVSKTRDIDIDVDDTLNLYKYVDDNYSANEYDWSSDSTSYVSVTSKGVITGKKKGDATVTATYSSGSTKLEYIFNVDVNGSSSSSSNSRKISIDVDDTKDLYSYVDDDYDARDYTWRSNSTNIVTVTVKGVIKGIKDGSATVTALYDEDDEYLKYTFNVTVGDGDDNSSSSSKVKAKTSWEFYLDTGDEVDVSSILEDDPDEYDWDSDDEDVAAYDEDDGIISAEDEGQARVRARGDTDYTFKIHVDNDYSFEEITIDGDDEKEVERYLDHDVDEYEFSSDRTDVATVSRKGIITGKANGIATILCEHEDGDVTQLMVEVKGIKSTSVKKETSTETTTAAKPVSNPFATTVSNPFATAVSFTDISHRAWAVNAINSMASKGFIAGVGNNKFSPDANCKRCDFVIVLIKILGMDKDTASENFSDIPSGSYYSNYVGLAKSIGIDAGVKNDKFRPDDYITRNDMMVMVYQGLMSKGIEMNDDTSVLVNYTDSIEISAADETAVASLINGGYISGTSATTLEPSANITRAQMAVLMDNVYNHM